MSTAPLEERLAAAFAADARSGDVAVLIDEAETAATASDARAEQARTRALDPALPPPEVAAARKHMEDLYVRPRPPSGGIATPSRATPAASRPRDDARRSVAYDKARAERDQLAEELARVYPPLAEQLADIVARIAANDRTLRLINDHARPRDGEYLRSAEEVAREIGAYSSETGNRRATLLKIFRCCSSGSPLRESARRTRTGAIARGLNDFRQSAHV